MKKENNSASGFPPQQKHTMFQQVKHLASALQNTRAKSIGGQIASIGSFRRTNKNLKIGGVSMIDRRIQIISCLICIFVLSMTAKGICASEINMSDVRRLALLSVDEIIRGTPVTKISDSDYLRKIQNSEKPSLVIFYTNREKRSRNLATLIRYLALDPRGKINFFAYKVSEDMPVSHEVSLRLKKDYNLEKTPGTLLFAPRSDDNKGLYQIYKPIFIDYRTPSLFLWKRYYDVVARYINRFFPRSSASTYH